MKKLFKKDKSSTTISDLLRGTRAGRMQSVGYMQVIPLTSHLSDDSYVAPSDAHALISTTGYGTLSFQNPDAALMIVPCHAAYVVKHAAQDHAMTHTGLVDGEAHRAFNTAACIQQTQGGLIASGDYRMSILPFALREAALKQRRQKDYSKLWPATAKLNASLGIQGASHLEFFLKRFAAELDQFVAEFECVPRQVGAIILVNGQVVGIERAPSYSYWTAVWPALIRECYGSLSIQVASSMGESPPPATRQPLPEDIGSLEELGEAVARLADEEEASAETVVRELLHEQLVLEVDDTVAGVSVATVDHERFAGQVVRGGEAVVYASVIAKKRWLRDQDWKTAEPFSI